jgi:hypothetical protein
MPNAVVPLSVLAVKNNDRDKHPSLFISTVSDEEKKFYDTDTRTEARTGSSQLDRIAPETVNRLKNWRKIRLG